MGCKTVICIDTSASTAGNKKYFQKIKEILKSEKNKIIITWNTEAKITQSEKFRSEGGTDPRTFLNVIKTFNYDYNLIVTTDGQVCDHDVIRCKAIIDSCNILDRIQSFKMYFIGDTRTMNLKISSPFNKVKDKQIIINDDEPIKVVHINLVEELKYEDFKDDKAIVASILTLLQTHPGKKNELRSQICKVANRIIGDLATKSSIKEFYDNNDIDGCVEFVKKYDNSEKKIFQQSMSKVLNIFKKDNTDEYSLSHLSNTNVCKKQQIKASNMNYDDADVGDDDFICDILLTKCSFPCILVKLIEDPESLNQDGFSIIPDKLSKKLAEYPFLILDHDDIIRKIVKRVEHQLIDLYAYNNLEDKSRSPFTRDTLKGVFILHNDEASHDLVFKNNNRTISFIFGKNNKLPGNKVIWNVLFLYILIKYHPAWKEHENKLKEEILYICKNVTSLITLTPILNPTISENFEVCLWYIFNIAPKAFENTSSNVLRYVEGSEKFLEFYSYLSGKNFDEMKEKLKIWNLWKYFCRNRVNKNLKLEVLSLIQNHEVINNSIVLLSGEPNCEHQSECVCKKFNVKPEIVLKLYNVFKKKSNPKLFDYVDFDLIHKDENKIPKVVIKDNFNEELLKHVSICITTCQPTVVCPVTGKHWKECSGSYDVNTESYVRLFKRFCFAKKQFPNDVNELLVFYSNRINFNNDDVVVCPLNIKTCLQTVLERYSGVVKKYAVAVYLAKCNTNTGEKQRLEIEKTCNKRDCHKQVNP